MLLAGIEPATQGLKDLYNTTLLQKHGGDGETRTLIPLQVTGVQAQTDTDFWLRLHNGTPNEIQTRDARMKTVWLNRLPIGAWALRQESNLHI